MSLSLNNLYARMTDLRCYSENRLVRNDCFICTYLQLNSMIRLSDLRAPPMIALNHPRIYSFEAGRKLKLWHIAFLLAYTSSSLFVIEAVLLPVKKTGEF